VERPETFDSAGHCLLLSWVLVLALLPLPWLATLGVIYWRLLLSGQLPLSYSFTVFGIG